MLEQRVCAGSIILHRIFLLILDATSSSFCLVVTVSWCSDNRKLKAILLEDIREQAERTVTMQVHCVWLEYRIDIEENKGK